MRFGPNNLVISFSINLSSSLCKFKAGVCLRMENLNESMWCSKLCSSNECMDKADFSKDSLVNLILCLDDRILAFSYLQNCTPLHRSFLISAPILDNLFCLRQQNKFWDEIGLSVIKIFTLILSGHKISFLAH